MRLHSILLGVSLAGAVTSPAPAATLDVASYLAESWTISGTSVTYRADVVVTESGFSGNLGWLFASGAFNMPAASYSVWINAGTAYSLTGTEMAGGCTPCGANTAVLDSGGIGAIPAGTYNIDVQATFTKVAAGFTPELTSLVVSTADSFWGYSAPAGATLSAVPLPAALPLFAGAVAALAGLALRRRAGKAA